MGTNSRVLMLGAALLLTASPRLLAQVTITEASGGTGENILWHVEQYGTDVHGTVNGTTFGVTADNNGSGELLHASGGQATVDRVDPADHKVILPLHALGLETETGVGFEEYIFDASRSGLSGSSYINFAVDYVKIVDGTFGHYISPTDWFIDQGSNWFTFTADSGFLLTRIEFTTPTSVTTGDDGLESAKQLRLSGAQRIPPPVVPEGSSLALIMGGLVPVAGLLRRRRA